MTWEAYISFFKSNILDLGCETGRDSLAFKNKGYYVDAMNYSEELVKKAMKLTGISVRCQSFYDIGEVAVYDVFVHVYLHYIENVIS